MKPRLGVMLGDPCGIGPELIAKLLVSPDVRQGADILVVGDDWVLKQGAAVAGVHLDIHSIRHVQDTNFTTGKPNFLPIQTVDPEDVNTAEASAAGGQSALSTLSMLLDLAKAEIIDAILFAPLNKQAMHMAGLAFEDELRWFANELDYHGPCSEFNVLEELWTSRVTSHVALREVSALLSAEGIVEAVKLIDSNLRRAGNRQPRIAVAALNPHAGDGGVFGHEEIEIIGPAVAQAQADGISVDGPFPSDTVFLKARDGEYDGIVTMYHDQGQIAMKLMGFDRGVTVQGGLPIPIATPAHGTAFDIAGQGKANVEAMRQAFFIACNMGRYHRDSSAGRLGG